MFCDFTAYKDIKIQMYVFPILPVKMKTQGSVHYVNRTINVQKAAILNERIM
jgi:hypothetical protein